VPADVLGGGREAVVERSLPGPSKRKVTQRKAAAPALDAALQIVGGGADKEDRAAA
jgi:hypothetical protein